MISSVSAAPGLKEDVSKRMDKRKEASKSKTKVPGKLYIVDIIIY